MKTSQPLKSTRACDQILKMIRDGALRPGDRLPTERALAHQMGFNHLTVREAMKTLAKNGVLVRKPRVGTFVKRHQPRELLTRVALALPHYLVDKDQPERHSVSQMISGVVRVIDQREYAVSVLSYRPGMLWTEVGPAVTDRDVRGILLFPQRDITEDDLRRFKDADVHVVSIGDDPRLDGLGLVTVGIDLVAPFAEALHRLVAMGHRRIACALYETYPHRAQHERILADVCKSAGLADDPSDLIINVPNRELFDFAVLSRVIEQKPQFTAVIVLDEFCAARIFRQAYEIELRIPRDLSIVCLLDHSPHAHPMRLAAPDCPRLVQQVTERGAQTLLRMIGNEPVDEQKVLLKAAIQWHDSVAEPPVQS